MDRIRGAQKARKRSLTLYRSRRTTARTKRQCKRALPEDSDDNLSENTDVDVLGGSSADEDNNDRQNLQNLSGSIQSEESILNSSKSAESINSDSACEDFSDETIKSNTLEEREQYTDRCVDILTDRTMCTELVKKLYYSNNLDDFMILIQSLHNGNLPMDNIVLLLMLEKS